jgi:hypothetical protein
MALKPPPRWIRRWPRGLRLGMAWTAVVLTVLVGGPAAITGLFLMFRFDQCAVILCSGEYRFLVATTTLAILLPIILFWARFLQRVVSYRDADDATDDSDYIR